MRYGFRGLSDNDLAEELGRAPRHPAESWVVVAYLGNGAPLCTITNGRSVSSTMEIPALDRLPNTVKVDAAQSEEIYHLREHHTFET